MSAKYNNQILHVHLKLYLAIANKQKVFYQKVIASTDNLGETGYMYVSAWTKGRNFKNISMKKKASLLSVCNGVQRCAIPEWIW